MVAAAEPSRQRRSESSRTAGVSMAVRVSEAHALIAAAPTEELRLLLTCLWVTGARVSEIVQLKAMDIWAPDALHLINEKQHKADANGYRPTEYKTVYVPETVVADLQRYVRERGIAPTGYVFPGRTPGDHMDRRTVWKHVKRLAEQLRIARERPGTALRPRRLTACYPHLFRHGHAVHALQQGALLTTVQRQLGHANLKTTSIYLDVADEDRRADAKRLKF